MGITVLDERKRGPEGRMPFDPRLTAEQRGQMLVEWAGMQAHSGGVIDPEATVRSAARRDREQSIEDLTGQVAGRWFAAMLTAGLISLLVNPGQWFGFTMPLFLLGGVIHYAIAKADLPTVDALERQYERDIAAFLRTQ